MLALDQKIRPGVFADHANPDVQHIVPDRLQLATQGAAPDFELMLFRSETHGGGQLTARFQALHSVHGVPSPALAQRQRIVLRSMADDLDVLLDWQTVFDDAEGAVLFRHALSADQAALAAQLARDGSPLFEIALEQDRAAMRGPRPWQVRAPADRLHEALMALIGTNPISAEGITGAVQSLPRDILEWQPLGPVETIPDDRAWGALAARLRDRLFAPDAQGQFSLRPPASGTLDLRLDRDWAELLRTRLTWGFDQAPELIAEDAIARHFPRVDQSDPFVNTQISVVNLVQLDQESASKLHVDLAYTGHSGTQTHESLVFLPDGPQHVSRSIVFASFTGDFALHSRSRAILPPSGGQGFPVLWPPNAEFVDHGASLIAMIHPGDLDLQTRRVEVDPGVFAIADTLTLRLESEVYTAVVPITPDRQAHSITLPGTQADYALSVEATRDGETRQITPVISAPDILILAQDLVPDEPQRLTATLGADVVFAILEWQPLDGTQPLQRYAIMPDLSPEMLYWPASVFDPVALRWRASVVRRDADGTTQPMVDGVWAETTETHFHIG